MIMKIQWNIEDYIKIYNEESNEGYFLETDVQHVENIHELHNDSTLFEVEKLVAKLHDKTECIIHIKNLKETLNHGLVLS